MSEDNERELTREELKAQLAAEFQAEQESSPEPASEPEDKSEQDDTVSQVVDGTDAPSQETENAEPDLPNHKSGDHLPIKATWQVIVYSIFYFAFGAFLLFASLSLIFSGDTINLFGWVFIIFFLIGGLASLYSTYDEFRHLKNARLLDSEGVSFKATILDNWVDHYQDGGFLGRKKVYHLLYLYNDEKNYAKHSVNHSMAKTLHTGSSITIEYLQDNPEVFRIK